MLFLNAEKCLRIAIICTKQSMLYIIHTTEIIYLMNKWTDSQSSQYIYIYIYWLCRNLVIELDYRTYNWFCKYVIQREHQKIVDYFKSS